MFRWKVPKQRQPLDVSYVTDDSLAVATITGHMYLFSVSDQQVLSKVKLHQGSVRSISVDSNLLLSGGKNKDLKLTDVNGMTSVRSFDGHSASISKVFVQGNVVISGNDDGEILLHDLRQPKIVYEWSDVHDDYISDLLMPDNKTLLSCSGDGFLSVFDIRKVQQPNSRNVEDYGLVARSDDQECDLTCLALMKHGKKVVCGMGNDTETVAGVFSYGMWGDLTDRLILQGSSIECMLQVDEDKLLLGCDKPILASILPNKCLRTVELEEFSGVEAMTLRGNTLAIISTDDVVSFVPDFGQFLGQEQPKQVRNKKRKLVTQSKVDPFYADL